MNITRVEHIGRDVPYAQLTIDRAMEFINADYVFVSGRYQGANKVNFNN